MKKFIRFHSEGSEMSNSSSFPHRTLRKTMPSIASKIIPVHRLQINRGYKGSTVDVATFDHWAYVPPQLNKRQIEKMYHQIHVKSKEKRKSTYSAIEKYSDRSQLTLKQYLKRKQKKSTKDMMYYSQIINLKKKESLFQRNAGKTDYLSLATEQQHKAELPKKEHLKTRLKHSWFSKRQKIIEHLRQRQSYNVTSTEFNRSKDNCSDKLYPPRYTHLPRDSKGFLITHQIDVDVHQFFKQ